MVNKPMSKVQAVSLLLGVLLALGFFFTALYVVWG